MNQNMLFTMALGIQGPWQIGKVEFREGISGKELHLYVEHKKGVRFDYEGKDYAVYDHQDRTWRHLNFFEHVCYLHASVPRVKTDEDKVKLVSVPWAKPDSSFTLLFEAYSALLVKDGMSMSKAGNYVNESYKVIYRIIKSMVVTSLITQPLEDVRELAIDETSTKKGHNYFTILSDRKNKKVVGVSEGKGYESAVKAIEEMEYRGAQRTKVRCITMDMSASYIRAAKEILPQADIVFDRYHISAQMNKAVDEVRRKEQRDYSELTKSRYLWLRNNYNLSEENQEKVAYLADAYPTIGTAYRCKELLREVLNEAKKSHLLKGIKEWMKMAMATKIEPIQKFVKMLQRHWYGIKTYFKRLATNAYAERVNLKIQEIKRVAKGYRNKDNYKIMIYFHLGGLDLSLPTVKG